MRKLFQSVQNMILPSGRHSSDSLAKKGRHHESKGPQVSHSWSHSLALDEPVVENDSDDEVFQDGYYIEDDYCDDHSSTDSESVITHDRVVPGDNHIQSVEIGISSFCLTPAKTNALEQNTEDTLYYDRSCQDGVDNLGADITPVDLCRNDPIDDTKTTEPCPIQPNRSNLLTVTADVHTPQKPVNARSCSYLLADHFCQTPNRQPVEILPVRPKKKQSLEVAETVGPVHFYIGEDHDEVDYIADYFADVASENANTSHQHNSQSKLNQFSNMATSSSDLPIIAHQKVRRPSERRESGYISKIDSPGPVTTQEFKLSPEESNESPTKTSTLNTQDETVRSDSITFLDFKTQALNALEDYSEASSLSSMTPLPDLQPTATLNELDDTCSPYRLTRRTSESSYKLFGSLTSVSYQELDPEDLIDIGVSPNTSQIKKKKVGETAVINAPSTPVSKIAPTPISSSSPFVKSMNALNSLSKMKNYQEADVLSPVRRYPPKAQTHTSKSKKRVVKRTLQMGSSTEKSSCESKFERKMRKKPTNQDKENVKPHHKSSNSSNKPFCTDYLILKRVAHDIAYRIPGCRRLWDCFNFEKLIEYLNNHFKHKIKTLRNDSIKSIWAYRNMKLEQTKNKMCDIDCKDSVATLLTAILLTDEEHIENCIDFIFKNLKNVTRECKDFLLVPPELMAMMLGNENCVVLNSQGFPLTYNQSEVEVMKAATYYMRSVDSDGSKNFGADVNRRMKRLLSSMTDKSALKSLNKNGSPLLRSKLGLLHGNLKVSDTGQKEDSHQRLVFRSYHEIRYENSKPLITATNTRQEHLIQPFLSNAYENSKGSISRSQDRSNLADTCNDAQVLRKISASYRMQNKVPYISNIELQYSSTISRKNRRKLTLGDSMGKWDETQTDYGTDTSDSGMYSRSTSMSSCTSLVGRGVHLDPRYATGTEWFTRTTVPPRPCHDDGGMVRGRPMMLRKGEHVTGVKLQGDTVLHNMEFLTNFGRRCCLHEVPCPSAPWKDIPLPLGGAPDSPHCLQSIFADTKKAGNHTYLRAVGAVWAVMSTPLNNLNV